MKKLQDLIVAAVLAAIMAAMLILFIQAQEENIRSQEIHGP